MQPSKSYNSFVVNAPEFKKQIFTSSYFPEILTFDNKGVKGVKKPPKPDYVIHVCSLRRSI